MKLLSRHFWRTWIPGLLAGSMIHDTYQILAHGIEFHRLASIAICSAGLVFAIRARKGAIHYSYFIIVCGMGLVGGVVLLTIGALTRPWFDPINLVSLSLIGGAAVYFLTNPTAEDIYAASKARATAVSMFTDIVNKHGPDSPQAEEFMRSYAFDAETTKLFQTVQRITRDIKRT